MAIAGPGTRPAPAEPHMFLAPATMASRIRT
jgi:hypothetical protein